MSLSWPRLAVSAGIWRGDEILLIRRAKAPMSNRWTFPGGHVEPGEMLADAVRREVREETGLEVEPVGEPMLNEIILHAGDGSISGHHVLLVFAARALDDRPPIAASDAADARFMPLAAIDALETTPRLAHYIAGTRERLVGRET